MEHYELTLVLDLYANVADFATANHTNFPQRTEVIGFYGFHPKRRNLKHTERMDWT